MPTALIVEVDGSSSTPTSVVWSLSSLLAAVRERISESEEDFWTDDLVKSYLNEAQQRFLHEERWSWLQTHVGPVNIDSGTDVLNIQNDVPLNRQFMLLLTASGTTTSYTPKRVSPQEGFGLRAQFTSSGIPQWFYLAAMPQVGAHAGEATQAMTPAIKLVPTPSLDMTAEYLYFREPAQMVGDNDTPDCPTAYVDAIISWATGLCWLKELNGGGKAQEQFNLYQAVLEQARKDELGAPNDSVLVMGKTEPEINWSNKSPFGTEFPLTLGP